jgi:hypothetical protein
MKVFCRARIPLPDIELGESIGLEKGVPSVVSYSRIREHVLNDEMELL